MFQCDSRDGSFPGLLKLFTVEEIGNISQDEDFVNVMFFNIRAKFKILPGMAQIEAEVDKISPVEMLAQQAAHRASVGIGEDEQIFPVFPVSLEHDLAPVAAIEKIVVRFAGAFGKLARKILVLTVEELLFPVDGRPERRKVVAVDGELLFGIRLFRAVII